MFHGTRDITTLYRLSFSIYICPFHVRARCRRLYIRAHDISPRSYGRAHFRPGYVHGYVKRKHRGDRYRHGMACPCFMVSPIPFREVDLYESPRQEFYSRRGDCRRTRSYCYMMNLPMIVASTQENNANHKLNVTIGEAVEFGITHAKLHEYSFYRQHK